jgi:mRNA interferase HigB
MRIVSRNTLQAFWEKHPDSAEPLKAWFKVAKGANWKTPQEIKDCYGNASFVGKDRAVFNIAGNKYRLITLVNYPAGILFIKFVGTHSEYDKIEAASVQIKKAAIKKGKKK